MICLFLQVADGLCLRNAHVVKADPSSPSDWSALMKRAALIIDLENEDDTGTVCVCVCCGNKLKKACLTAAAAHPT